MRPVLSLRLMSALPWDMPSDFAARPGRGNVVARQPAARAVPGIS